MASIAREKTTTGVRYYIQLSPGEDEGRGKIRLGQVTRKDALSAKGHIGNLIRHRKTGEALRPATQDWLAGLPNALRDRLEKLRLAEPRNTGSTYTVKEWTDSYLEMREKDSGTKPDTVRKLENVARRLSAFFRTEKLDEISVYDAKAFKGYLRNVVGLSENTARKHIAISRQFFNAAIDKKIVSENPFRGQPVTVRPNESRFFFITPEIARKVLEACPDVEWRLIFGLARFGGLRCPSEVLRLTWNDIDFANEQFTVHASKTEHHSNGGIRVVPIFPELKPLFQDAFDAAKDGAVYCITRYRDKAVNLRTQMNKIIARAGVEPWPKTFQNLRSTRETELFKLTGGNVKAVCQWIGNSPETAMKHYAQVTEADMKEAAKMAVMNDAEKAVHNPVHNPVQNTAVPSRTESRKSRNVVDVTPCNCKGIRQEDSGVRDHAKSTLMGRAGFEPAKALANGFTAHPL